MAARRGAIDCPHDFAFWLEIVQNTEVEAPHLQVHYKDVTAEVPDAHTLIIRWPKTEYTNVNNTLGLTPLPRHVYARYDDGSEIPAERLGVAFNDHWFDQKDQVIGVGPYQLISANIDEGYRFRVSPRYWHVTPPISEHFWDTSIVDPEAALVAFKNGERQAQSLTAAQYQQNVVERADERFAALDPENPKSSRDGVFGWERIGQPRWSGIAWNMTKPTLAQREVRQALAHAFPRERVLKMSFLALVDRKRARFILITRLTRMICQLLTMILPQLKPCSNKRLG